MEGKASLFFLSLLFLHFPKNHSSLSGAVTLQFCFFFFLPLHTMAKSRAVKYHRAHRLKIYFVEKCKTLKSKFDLASFNYF